jgi:hypothetical protein
LPEITNAVSAGIGRLQRDVAGEVGQGRRDATGKAGRGLGERAGAERRAGRRVASGGRGAEPEAGVLDEPAVAPTLISGTVVVPTASADR